MKVINVKFFIWFVTWVVGLTVFCTLSVDGQEQDMKLLKSTDFDPLKVDKETIFEEGGFYLPPLSALIDSAFVNSPLLIQFGSENDILKSEVELARKAWTDYLYTQSEFKFGSTDNVTFSQEGNTYDSRVNTVVTSRYQIGLGLRFSAFDLIDRKHNIAIAKEKQRIAEAQLEGVRRQIRKEVTLLFNNVILTQRILTIKSETQQAKLLHFSLAEKQFLEGEISVSDYAGIIEMIAKSSADFETAKMDFTNAYFLLEESVGINLQELKKRAE